MSNYQYPIDETWTKEEIIEVIHFYTLIEKAYESSVDRNEMMKAYRKFKKVVPSKSEEKGCFSEFEKGSTYSSYHVIQKAKESPDKNITMLK